MKGTPGVAARVFGAVAGKKGQCAHGGSRLVRIRHIVRNTRKGWTWSR